MENILKKIVNNMEKAIIGKREAVELTVTALAAGGHVLIEDVPGVGKTTLVKALARSVNATFGRIQCTPDVLPSDITGFNMYNTKTGDMEYREGLIERCRLLLCCSPRRIPLNLLEHFLFPKRRWTGSCLRYR